MNLCAHTSTCSVHVLCPVKCREVTVKKKCVETFTVSGHTVEGYIHRKIGPAV